MGIEDLNNFNYNRENEEKYEYYEDTHDETGAYIPRKFSFTEARAQEGREDGFHPRTNNLVEKDPPKEQVRAISNVMVYEPKKNEDSQTIIDYVKKGEPIILNLEQTPEDCSQRILDFVAGANYALGGSIHRISGDVFLIAVAGVKVIMQEKEDKR